MILTRVIIVTMLKIKMKTTSKKRKRRHNRRLTWIFIGLLMMMLVVVSNIVRDHQHRVQRGDISGSWPGSSLDCWLWCFDNDDYDNDDEDGGGGDDDDDGDDGDDVGRPPAQRGSAAQMGDISGSWPGSSSHISPLGLLLARGDKGLRAMDSFFLLLIFSCPAVVDLIAVKMKISSRCQTEECWKKLGWCWRNIIIWSRTHFNPAKRSKIGESCL